MIAGSRRTSTDSAQRHCFIWRDGHMTDIGALPGPPDCYAVPRRGCAVPEDDVDVAALNDRIVACAGSGGS